MSTKYYRIQVLAIYVALWLDDFFILISRMKRKIAEVFRSVTSLKDTRTLHVSCILTGFCKTLMLFFQMAQRYVLSSKGFFFGFAPKMSIHFSSFFAQELLG